MEERKQHFERPTMQRQPSMVSLTLLTVIVAIIASFGGFFLAQYFFPADSQNFPIIGSDRTVNINIEQPLTNLAGKYDDRVAGIYRNVPSQARLGQPLFTEQDYLGAGLVITSDGWIMTTDQTGVTLQSLVVIDDKIYNVSDIRKDDFSDVVFARVAAAGLTPADFQLADQIRTGERIFAQLDEPASITHSFFSAEVSNSHYELEQYLSSDFIDYYLQFSPEYTSPSQNTTAAPYFNLQGAVLGMEYTVGEEKLLIPSEYLRQAVRHLLDNTDRPILGITYVDMENQSGFLQKGNLVFAAQGSAVQPNSAADQAGLKILDQIVAVNNDVITQNRTITSIIQNYRVGDTVVLKVLREGSEIDLSVTL